MEPSESREIAPPRRVLDLFCGAGGAAMGYHRAWPDAEIVGVDLHPQPRYPFTFVQGDALEYLWDEGYHFDFVHASPPCQHYSAMSACRPGLADEYPDLVAATRWTLQGIGRTYVIENVPGSPLVDPVTLCGQMFGLELYRHRLFEASFPIEQPEHPAHVIPASKAGHWKPGTIMSVAGHVSPIAKAREVMGIDWMNRAELGEAIPPAFTQYVGEQFSAWHTSQPAALAAPQRTPRTTARRAADVAEPQGTSRTADSLDAPSGDDERPTHRGGPERASGATARQDSSATGATHDGGRHGSDGDGVRHDGVADLRHDVADLEFTEALGAHAVIQPHSQSDVNHKLAVAS